MRNASIILLTIAGILQAGCSSASSSGSDERISILQDGVNRFVYLHIPDGYSADVSYPLLLVFHGSGDSGAAFQQHSGIDKKADQQGFIVAYPSSRGSNWAEGCDCTQADIDGVDDVGLVDEIIDIIDDDYSLNRDRVFAAGYSQGAFFTQRLACERSSTFKGVASISGMMSSPMASSCQPEVGLDVLLMHGTDDGSVPITGFQSGGYQSLSSYETMLFWREANDCPLGLERQTYDDTDLSRDVRSIGQCRDNSQVRMDEILEGRHQWYDFIPGEIVEFFGL